MTFQHHIQKSKTRMKGARGILIGKERKPSLHLKNTGFLDYMVGGALNESRGSD